MLGKEEKLNYIGWESRGKNSSAKEPYWALCKNKPGIFFKPVERSRLQVQLPNVVVINVL